MSEILDFENLVIAKLKRVYKLKIEDACFSTDWIPKHILLDRTKNIHSYFVFVKFKRNEYNGRFFKNKDCFSNDITELIKTQFSRLDRPLFLIIQNENDNLLSIEGNVIREFLLITKPKETLEDFIKNEIIDFKEIIYKIKTEL